MGLYDNDPLAPPTCGTHEAFIYERGGTVLVGQLTGITFVSWERTRDDISKAEVRMVGSECCEVMMGVGTILHELWIYRSGTLVWSGVITRLEFEYDGIDVFAEDFLWILKKKVTEVGYNFLDNPANAVEAAAAICIFQGFLTYGNPWNIVDVQPLYGPNDIQTLIQTNPWSTTIWDTLDVMAEDGGIDYVMVNRTLRIWDVHTMWYVLQPLEDTHISTFPRIVEYGNEFANRVVYTDGSGYAGVATSDSATLDTYTRTIDYHIAIEDRDEDEPPSQLVLSHWYDAALRNVQKMYPPQQSIIVPANSTLMPSSPWVISEVYPGAWCQVSMERMCRNISEWQKLDAIKVVEDVDGERVQVTLGTAPSAFQEVAP